MLTDQDLVGLCAAIYDPTYTGWDHFWSGAEPDGICAGIKDNRLVFRGSRTLEDWVRDVIAGVGTAPFAHAQLGQIPLGFWRGMHDFLTKALPLLGDGAAFGGHSLGAAHAQLAAGVYIAQGGHPGRITVCGSPRPGCEQLRQLLRPYPLTSFKNRYDPVTEVPMTFPNFPAIQMAEFNLLNILPVELASDPRPWLDFNPLMEHLTFEDHHIELYVRGAAIV